MIRHLLLILIAMWLVSCGNAETESGQTAPTDNQTTETSVQSPAKKRNIVFFGNSLTAAYGLEQSEGFVSLLQQRIDSLGLPYKTINAGLSGETTAGGRERVDWVLRQPVDIFMLELGGNDALRGIDPATAYKNLEAIIQKVREKYPDARIILAGMQAPPNMGERYTGEFREIYPRLAEAYDTALIPFFLEGVGGVPELNQGDRIHPNEEGQKILVENVWDVLHPMLVSGD